jgi:DNA-binding transcriptional ArsR family regulator
VTPTRTDRTDVYRAVADPSRRVLLNALVDGPRSFQDLHALLDMTKGAVSQHLSVLVAAGLVTVNPGDRSRRYALTPAPLAEVDEWLDRYRSFWEDRLDALEVAVRRRRRGRPA